MHLEKAKGTNLHHSRFHTYVFHFAILSYYLPFLLLLLLPHFLSLPHFQGLVCGFVVMRVDSWRSVADLYGLKRNPSVTMWLRLTQAVADRLPEWRYRAVLKMKAWDLVIISHLGSSGKICAGCFLLSSRMCMEMNQDSWLIGEDGLWWLEVTQDKTLICQFPQLMVDQKK